MPMGNRKITLLYCDDYTYSVKYRYTVVYDNGGDSSHGRNAFDGGGLVADTGTGLRWQ
jgi:hypothetical protein